MDQPLRLLGRILTVPFLAMSATLFDTSLLMEICLLWAVTNISFLCASPRFFRPRRSYSVFN